MSETVKYRDLWYIAKYGDGSIIDDLIRIATKIPNPNALQTTHFELWEPEPLYKKPQLTEYVGMGFRHGNKYLGQCWTSTTRGKVKGGFIGGTCVRPASEVLKHPERWLYTEWEVDIHYFECGKHNARNRVLRNKGYAWRNLARYGMPLWLFRFLRMEDKLRETCSQHGEHWKIDMALLQSDKIRSPRRLWTDTVKGTHIKTRRLIDDGLVYIGTMKVGKIFV